MKYLKLFENFENKLTKDMIINLFVNSLEGGSNSWYYIKDIPTEVINIKTNKKISTSEAIGEYIIQGGKIYIYDIEDDDELLGYIDMDKLLDAVNIIKKEYPNVYSNITARKTETPLSLS